MNYIREGDLVIIVGKIDTRVRDTINSDLIIGTVDQLLSDQQVSVILENGDLWVGPSRDVVLKSEQE
jgi:translation initiation factor IF-1